MESAVNEFFSLRRVRNGYSFFGERPPNSSAMLKIGGNSRTCGRRWSFGGVKLRLYLQISDQ